MEQEEESIEINFQLDAHGRTTTLPPPPQKLHSSSTACACMMDYQTRTVDTSVVEMLASSSGGEDDSDSSNSAPRSFEFPHHRSSKAYSTDTSTCTWHDDILLDCEIADSGLMPRTFWVPAANDDSSFTPRCTLEQWAHGIFHHHVRRNANNKKNKKNGNDDSGDSSCTYVEYDPTKPGAEWWVQIRPQLNAQGRYEMHANDDDYDRNGICFHWDKDEDLRLACGGNVYIHPHLSTVTYLTDHGAPTLVVNARIHNLQGTWIPPTTAAAKASDGTSQDQEQECYESFISWPSAGKHLSFDGRYLHAAPGDLLLPNSKETLSFHPHPNKKEQSTSSTAAEPSSSFSSSSRATTTTTTTTTSTSNLRTREEKRLARRNRRITFLCNIWLNYKPLNVEPFPETMLDKMSGSSSRRRQQCRQQQGSSSSSSPKETASATATTRRSRLRFGNDDGDASNTTTLAAVETRTTTTTTTTTAVTISNGKVLYVVDPTSAGKVDATKMNNASSSSSSAAAAAAAATTRTSLETFTWPMGSDESGETIQMLIPLQLVQQHQAQVMATDDGDDDDSGSSNSRHGGNVQIHYINTPSSSSSNSTTNNNNSSSAIHRHGVVLSKKITSKSDDAQEQTQEKRTCVNDDDNNDDMPHNKRPHSEDHDGKP